MADLGLIVSILFVLGLYVLVTVLWARERNHRMDLQWENELLRDRLERQESDE